jgi:hypothetical protein
MQDILDFLLANPWLAVLLLMGIVGNIGSSAARRQQQRRRHSPPRRTAEQWEELPEPERGEAAGPSPEEELARRIREVMLGPSAAPAAPPPPAPVVPSTSVEDMVAATPLVDFDSFDGVEAEEQQAQARAKAAGGPSPPPDVPAAAKLAEADPREAFRAILLLGRPRGLEAWEEDPSRAWR